jgi:hypothetical protein
MSATARLQQVILTCLILHEELEGSRFPNTCNKTEAKSEGAQKVWEQDHGRLLDEITRMEILEFVEAEDDIMDHSGSEGEQSMDDGEDEPMDDGDDEYSMMDDVEQQIRKCPMKFKGTGLNNKLEKMRVWQQQLQNEVAASENCARCTLFNELCCQKVLNIATGSIQQTPDAVISLSFIVRCQWQKKDDSSSLTVACQKDTR